jgi:hypothetical protein
MNEKIQAILSEFYNGTYEEGDCLDRLLALLHKGDGKDRELYNYIVFDTTEEGDDYLTDYQCIELIENTYQ